MNRHDYAELYLKCWAEADVAKGMEALSDDFVFHNPRVGKITKSQFESYFGELLKMLEPRREHPFARPFMELADHVSQDDGTTLTTWVWWKIPGSSMEGAGITKTTDSGVVSHRSANYVDPQWSRS